MTIGALMRYLMFINRFGKIQGTKLFIQFISNKTNKIKINNIKHFVTLRPHTSDFPLFIEIFVKEKYNVPINFYPSVFIDGGANIGLTTVFFKNKFPHLKIIAVEPDPENFSILQCNVSKYSDVHLIQSGIWNNKIYANLSDNKQGNWAIRLEETPKNKDSIETITIDEIMCNYNIAVIDILKLDIETAERQLFTSNYSSWLPKTKMIIIELHDRLQRGCAKTFFDAISSTFYNYSFYQKDENSIIINEDMFGQDNRTNFSS
jgi:FkbM family methyltransferase